METIISREHYFWRLFTEYKTLIHTYLDLLRVLPIPDNPKDLDASYKTDLDLFDCFGRGKSVLLPKKYGTLTHQVYEGTFSH